MIGWHLVRVSPASLGLIFQLEMLIWLGLSWQVWDSLRRSAEWAGRRRAARELEGRMVLGIHQAHERHGNPESLKRELDLSASLGASQGEASVAGCIQVLLKGVLELGKCHCRGARLSVSLSCLT